MGFDMSFLDQNGISTKEGLGYTGGADKYISALQRYYKGYEANRDAVSEYLSANDMDSYAIKVHSLKSNSKMIGATKLGALFEELEMAAKSGNDELVKSKTGEALDLYAQVIGVIRPIGEAVSVKAQGEISADEAKETAEKLLEALDDFDDERSAELAAKLEGYPFRLTQREKLKDAVNYISEFMYDEAADLIREIVPAIE